MDATPSGDDALLIAARSSPVKSNSALARPSSPTKNEATGPGASEPPATGTTANSNSTMSTATAANPALAPTASHALAMTMPTSAQKAVKDAPPMVNAAIAVAAPMTSTAMTPTTANYGMSEQLVKSTGTLTPLGEDKISTAGPSGTQKAKQTRKKATPANGEAGAKKPSPRVRAKPDPNKAEKRKASPARNGKSTPTNGNTSAPMTSVPPSTSVPTTTTASMQASTAMGVTTLTPTGQQQELLPSQDNDLRRQFLQRVYRQLQMTHRNQDDAMVRQLATNVEIDICRRATSRNEYVTLMNQQINSLMQAELTNGTVGLQSSLYVPGVGMSASSNGMNVTVSTSGGMAQPGLQQASAAAYKQVSGTGSASSDVGLQTSAGSQGSFMSLLSSQAPMQGYDAARSQQQYGTQGLPSHGRMSQYGTMNSAPGYPPQGQANGQTAGVKSDPQGDTTSQQAYPGQRMSAQPNPTSAPPEFAAQFQRLDRSGLLDLLWTQHKTVIQYQRRLAQLEVQLNLRQPTGAPAPSNNMTPPASLPSSYYNPSPRQPSVPTVPANLSAEAEAQRARDRAASRLAQHPGQYAPPQYPPAQAPATPPGGVNPQMYWEKVRHMSEAYLRHLYVAHQALSQHSAPANSAQGAKAENVKHNIALACQILSEAPSNVQPRPLDVLDSIERFIQSTVVPIVRKVSPQAFGAGANGTPVASAQHMRPPQGAVDNEQSRNPMTMSNLSQGMPTPTAAGYANGQSPPVPAQTTQPAVPAPSVKGTAKAKGGAKTGGKKSPSNGPKKTTTPKATAPKTNARAGGKKSPGKAGGAKQTAAAKQASPSSVANADPATAPLSNQVGPPSGSTAPVTESAPKETAQIKAGALTDDDSLNDFADFADLDFDDDLQDPVVKVSSNKENAAGVNSRKRSVEDV